MTRLFNWLFPHPVMTLLLAVVWVILQNQVSAGMAVFGLILGTIIPRAFAAWWPDRPTGFNLGRMILYVLLVLYDIVIANVQAPSSLSASDDEEEDADEPAADEVPATEVDQSAEAEASEE